MSLNVQDLLDYAQINAKKFRKNYYKFNFEELVQNVIGMQQDKADDQQIELCYEWKPNSIQEEIVTDYPRLFQVMLGLQSNAIKYTQ